MFIYYATIDISVTRLVYDNAIYTQKIMFLTVSYKQYFKQLPFVITDEQFHYSLTHATHSQSHPFIRSHDSQCHAGYV